MKKDIPFLNKFLYVVALSIFLISVSSCGLDVMSGSNEQNDYLHQLSDKVSPSELVDANFSVLIPSPLGNGEVLCLDVLDEITGINENFTRHFLKSDDNKYYSVTIPVILNSEIKYRYVKVGDTDTHEITAFNSPVRYRMAHISENIIFKDTVAAWSDQTYIEPYGKLSGMVVDAKSGSGVPDILVSVAGYQTFTDMSGNFLIDGIHPGIHNLVAYAIDGSYETFQQGTNILSGLSTHAEIKLNPLPEVTVSFIVNPPNDAIGAPIRFAGNFYQLGNTFSDLSNGTSTLSSRMPLLIKMEDGRYGISLKLHAGSFLEYKYTLGDGIINAERDISGNYVIRNLIIPKSDVTIEDVIVTWRMNKTEPIPINITVPEDTPSNDSISMQLNNGSWLSPIPMWPMGNNIWFYLLYSPKPSDLGQLTIRFCRNDQCETAHDLDSYLNPFILDVNDNSGLNLELENWINWDQTKTYDIDFQGKIGIRDTNFLTGVELLSTYHPSFQNRYEIVFNDLLNIDSNFVILTPTWIIDINSNSPHFEPISGKSPLAHDLKEVINFAQELGMEVAIFPQLVFESDSAHWWNEDGRDALWWQDWYAEYDRFISNFALLTAKLDVDMLIIGGDFVSNTLPGALPKTDDSEGTPSNASYLWRKIIKSIDSMINGQIIWALPFSDEFASPPDFVSDVDGIYVLFDKNISSDSGFDNTSTLKINSEIIVDSNLYPLFLEFQKPIYIGISNPSADGSATACVLDLSNECNNSLLISPFDEQISSQTNLQEQADIYNALISIFSDRDWISGIVSRGFFLPVRLKDQSSSVYGKPAMEVIEYWYSNLK